MTQQTGILVHKKTSQCNVFGGIQLGSAFTGIVCNPNFWTCKQDPKDRNHQSLSILTPEQIVFFFFPLSQDGIYHLLKMGFSVEKKPNRSSDLPHLLPRNRWDLLFFGFSLAKDQVIKTTWACGSILLVGYIKLYFTIVVRASQLLERKIPMATIPPMISRKRSTDHLHVKAISPSGWWLIVVSSG